MTVNALKTQLEAACKDLWWSSEADYPVEVLWYELPESQRSVNEKEPRSHSPHSDSTHSDSAHPDSAHLDSAHSDSAHSDSAHSDSANDTTFDDALIREIAACDKNTTITPRPFDSFFDKYLTPKGWHTEADKQQLAQLSQLKTLLSEAFPHPQVYRCGDVEITLCIVGYASREIVAGIKTCIVET